MHSDLPARPKSQRLANRIKAEKPSHYFQLFKRRPQNILNINELLPGLNDISDAFEAMPLDLVKYFTLLKEIDAKCIKTIPSINRDIDNYIERIHDEQAGPLSKDAQKGKLQRIWQQIHEIVPCLEEKMHVTSVAADIMAKHMARIDTDYRVVVGNNEIPELVRLGPLNHRALVLDLQVTDASKSAHSQRSETRREAIAAKKANKDDDDESRKRRAKEVTPVEPQVGNGSGASNIPGNGANGKRRRKENEKVGPSDKKRTKPKREKDGEPGSSGSVSGQEPTYCYCNQVSFGEMVGCDGDTCEREWFHLPCIGFKNPPKGKWYCDDCLAKMKKGRK